METEAQLIVQRASLRLPRTTTSQLDPPGAGDSPGQILGLGKANGSNACVKLRLAM
jgi:hypothetical protein